VDSILNLSIRLTGLQVLQIPRFYKVSYILYRSTTLRCQLCLGTAEQSVQGDGSARNSQQIKASGKRLMDISSKAFEDAIAGLHADT
jgi:hypothetical protein